MSNSDYREVNNALNNYYGNKMNLYEVGSKYREEYRQKMEEQKKLVRELSVKAEAYDDIRYAMEMQTAIGVSDEDTLIDIDHVIMSLIERMESGGAE